MKHLMYVGPNTYHHLYEKSLKSPFFTISLPYIIQKLHFV